MGEGKQRAVVLLSGGMDSCVCAALASRDYAPAPVHISYGQRTEQRERLAFDRICDRLGIADRLVVRTEALQAVGGSALTDSRIAVPEVAEGGRGEPKAQIPVTYVPFRNAHFLAVAVSTGSGENIYWRGRTGQLGISRLPSRVLSSVQRSHKGRHEGRTN